MFLDLLCLSPSLCDYLKGFSKKFRYLRVNLEFWTERSSQSGAVTPVWKIWRRHLSCFPTTRRFRTNKATQNAAYFHKHAGKYFAFFSLPIPCFCITVSRAFVRNLHRKTSPPNWEQLAEAWSESLSSCQPLKQRAYSLFLNPQASTESAFLPVRNRGPVIFLQTSRFSAGNAFNSAWTCCHTEWPIACPHPALLSRHPHGPWHADCDIHLHSFMCTCM